MSGFFDDLVAATTADGPVGAVAGESTPADRQSVRTAAVLASAAVVTELARLTDGGGRWTWQRLLRPGASGTGGPGDPERGGSLTRMLFGERAGLVVGVIARDSSLAPAEAERVLGMSTEAAASLLADRVARTGQPDLRADSDALIAGGWGEWLAALAPDGPSSTPAEAAPLEPEVVALEPEVVALEPEAVPLEPEVEPASSPSPAPPVPGVEVAPDSGPTEPSGSAEDDERPSRRLLVAGAVTVVAAALVALAVSTRFGTGDGTIESDAGATTSITAGPAPSGTDDLATGVTEPAPASPGTTAAVAATATSAVPGPEAPVGPTTYRLALADPQGSTDAAGTVRLDLDPTAGTICYQFEVAGLTDPFPGHIHAAPTGASGGITVDFGYLTGAAPSGCVDSFPADVADIVRHPERHYVELHDTEYGFGVRSRLAQERPGGATPGASSAGTGTTTATDGSEAAAVTVLSGARVVLRGDVPDEAARSALIAGTADLTGQGFEVVDELTVRAGAPAPSGRVIVEQPLLFPFDSNQLAGDAARSVDELARLFQLRPQWRVTLVGNTDGVGDVVYNLTLSLRRAIAARNALVAAGVPPEAVTIRGDGPFAPVADNDTLDGRTRNRRIDVVIATTP